MSLVVNHPNLFIIGAAKSGTSSLAKYLSLHPDIFMSRFKEPAFFLGAPPPNRISMRHRRPFLADKYRSSLNEYLKLFSESRGKRIIGEASVGYSQMPLFEGVAQRIHSFNPDARIIYLLRDPVERAISQYWFKVETAEEMRDISTAITQDRLYTAVSHYAYQLRPYMSLFDRNNIKVITSESLRDRPTTVLQDLFSWLSVDRSYIPENIHERFNVTPKIVTQLTSVGVLHRIRHSRAWDIFGRLVPRPVRRMGRRFVEKQLDRKAVDHTSVIEYLRSIQISQTEELAALLGRQFFEWKTLYACHDHCSTG
jgi:hypothetical protein